MARKQSFDSELVKDTRRENKKQAQGAQEQSAPAAATEQPKAAAPPPPQPEPGPQQPEAPQPETNTQSDEFKKRFEEYFKGAGQFVSGQLAVEMVDDLKSNLLYIYAKKQGVDIDKSALKLDPKAKEFASFAVDYAIRNKALAWLEKYPVIAAAGVIVISAGSDFLVIQAMKAMQDKGKKTEDENEKLKAIVSKLEKALKEKQRAAATEAEVVSESAEPETHDLGNIRNLAEQFSA